jgi:hypothetical protein
MKTFYCSDIDLTHAQMLELRNAGSLNLGINDTLSANILIEKGIAPTSTTASAAFTFYNWIAVGIFIYSIYLSFTSNWWWFILGFLAKRVVWGANKKGGSENLLDAAMIDSEFYDRVKELGGWMYQMEESDAKKYLIGGS